ncbi:MAG: hypothetical protein QG585_644 [Patescibacteria group bacterium]|nr:hypothetical protein [Patescibacteria group bacterium]
MDKKNIEVELRSEIKKEEFSNLIKILKNNRQSRFLLSDRRISLLFIKENKKHTYDIRLRTTKNKTELAIKLGHLHSHNRKEIIIPILKKSFIDYVQLLHLLEKNSKVIEREYHVFKLKNIILTIVNANPIYYVEGEIMSEKSEINKNKILIENLFKTLKITPIKNNKYFKDLCDRLSKETDWKFNGTEKDYNRLEKLIKKY